MNETPRKADCYSGGEREAMEWTQRLRGRLLGPLLKLLAACGVNADHVTVLGMIVGLAFGPLFFWYPPAGLLALLGHVCLDGIDGSLARYLQVASPKGSFTDTMCDQIVVTVTTICLMLAPQPLLGVTAGGLYIFLYAMVVVFAMVRNALQIPYSWLVRPRFVIYVWIAVELYLLPGSLNYVVWLANGLLAWKMFTGFWKIRKRM